MGDLKSYKQISSGLMVMTLLGLTYSFGTFGLLNLFGLRVPVQALFAALSIAILLNIKHSYRAIDFILVLAFAITLGFGGIVHGGYITKPIEAMLMIFCIVAIVRSPFSQVIFLSKALAISSAIFCSLVAIAYIYYSFYPDQYTNANFNIYHSDVGSDQIYPNTLIDWISFTSGDGFEFQGESRIRLKGYSNEPSSTVVHYLAPSALAFFLGGRYIYIGIFIILVNIFAIGSLMAYVIILMSVVLFFALFLRKRYLKLMLYGILISLLTAFTQPVVIFDLFFRAGMMGIDLFGFDLISRKVGDGSDDASILIRLAGISEGLYLGLISPVGYSFDKLGAGAGLLYIVSASSGWLGILVFSRFILDIAKNILNYCKRLLSYNEQYAIALIISLIIVAILISGYGWDRLPGVIMLLLFYKLIAANLSDSRYQIKSSMMMQVKTGSSGRELCA